MGGVVVGAAAVVVPVAVIVVAVHLSLLFVDFHAQSPLPLPLLKCDNSIACTRHMHIFIYTHALYVSVH